MRELIDRLLLMQKKLDRYDYFIKNTVFLLEHPHGDVVLTKTEIPQEALIWDKIREMREYIRELETEIEEREESLRHTPMETEVLPGAVHAESPGRKTAAV
jgi:hypothetical protein